MKILGIETSCDETAAAVVKLTKNPSQEVAGPAYHCKLLSNAVATSLDIQAQYGGVVPEIAARSQIESIIPVVKKAVEDTRDPKANSDPWDEIDGIAVTYGAGLSGSLLVGLLSARTLAITKNKPLYAINHVEAHVYANFITSASPALSQKLKLPASTPQFPMLALIVSGGHSQLVLFKDHFSYTLLGQTHDDAIGEAFDKVAKILGLPYPGGPSIAQAAQNGDPYAYSLPKARSSKPQALSGLGAYDFSFSGLKTAVLREAQRICGKDHRFPSFELAALLPESGKSDLAASFQRVAIETVVDKTISACQEFNPTSLVIAGGVAANAELRRQLATRLGLSGCSQTLQYPDPALCTDNGAMVAALGSFKLALDQPPADPYSLDIEPNLSM